MDVVEKILAIAIGVIAVTSVLAPILNGATAGSITSCITGFMSVGTYTALIGIIFIVSLFMIVRAAWKKKA